MADQLGMRQDELVGRLCHEVMHGAGAPLTGCPHMRLLAGLSERTHDIQEVAGRGVFEVSCTPLRDRDGGVAGSVHVMHDISRRVHVEAHAEETAHYLQQVLDAVPTPIYHKDAEGRYVAVNKAFADAAGMDRDAIIGRTVRDVFPPEIAADFIEHDRALLAGGGRDSRAATGWDAVLGTRRVELHRSMYADLAGRPAGVVGVQFDVTEREQNEAALLRAQQDLVRAQAIGLMGSWEWDIAEGRLHWSDELYRVWGLDPESFTLTAGAIAERIHPEDRRANDLLLSRMSAGAQSAAIDFRIIRPGGEVRNLHQTLEVERDEAGTMVRAFGVMQDVTDMVQTREVLRRREALLRGLFDTMPSGCTVHEVHGDGRSAADYVVTDMNQSGLRMVQQRHKEEVVGKDLAALYGDDLDAATVETLWRVWRTGDPERFAVKRYDGGDLALWHDAFVLKLPSGEIVTISNDVTAEKRAEEAHRKSAAEVHAIFDLAGIPMLVMDTRGGLRRWNRALQKTLGYPPEDLRRMTIRDVTPPEEHPEMLRRLSAALGDGSAYRVERRMVTVDGQERWFDVSVTPVLDADGEVAALLLACTDVHERRLAEEALVQSQDRLRQALGGTVASMGAIVAIRDPYTAGHERRVADLVVAIAEELGLDEAQVNGLRHAASVHDVGKVAVPAEILTMPRRLSEWEYSLIQTHVEVGHGVLADIAFEQPVATTVLQHHERLDGSGYPGKLRGDEIVLPARILAVADVVEAMASDRPYRPALGVGAALDEIGWGAGRLYDEKVVAACQRVLRRGVVDLSTPPV
jgi:PAS domain S-box-containing protein